MFDESLTTIPEKLAELQRRAESGAAGQESFRDLVRVVWEVYAKVGEAHFKAVLADNAVEDLERKLKDASSALGFAASEMDE